MEITNKLIKHADILGADKHVVLLWYHRTKERKFFQYQERLLLRTGAAAKYLNIMTSLISRSTPLSRPNKVDQMSVRPSTKGVFNFNEIWYVGRGRQVMHDGMQYDDDPIQGQGNEPFKD